MRKTFLLILLFAFCSISTFSQENKTWNFPIKPGTNEWEKLSSYKERINAYNIPEKILYEMKTADLVATCLNYPEFRLIMTRNSLQQGYDYLKTIFNGFSELEKREDALKELLKVYKKIDPYDIKKMETSIKRGEFSFKLIYLEILIAQSNILLNLNNETKIELIKTCLKNYKAIQKLPENYGRFGLVTPVLILGRTMDLSNLEEFKTKKKNSIYFQSFINNTDILDFDTENDIILLSKSYLNKIDNE